MINVVEYVISDEINCLFDLPLDTARKLLPKGLEPVEPHHGSALLGITLFDFTESPVGPYQELVFSLYVVPRPGLTIRHPHAAVYPLVVASTHHEARQHAIDLWHLPHFMEDIRLEFLQQDDRSITGKVCTTDGETIVELSISESGPWKPVDQFYQSFQNDESGSYIGILAMEGRMTEHEKGTGSLKLYEDHRFFEQLDLSGLDPIPMREMWLKPGVEKYYEVIKV